MVDGLMVAIVFVQVVYSTRHVTGGVVVHGWVCFVGFLVRRGIFWLEVLDIVSSRVYMAKDGY